MTVTIQLTPPTTHPRPSAVRRQALDDFGGAYGRALSTAQLDELDHLDDRAALARAFPWLSAEELHEALWALGQR